MEMEDFKPQKDKMNKGTKYGENLIKHSIKTLGLARSIVVDKNNVIISGDKIYQASKQLGFTKVNVVETNGDTLVVVKRIDIDATKKKGMELSLVDNIACIENVNWDANAVENNMNKELSFNPKDWGGDAACIKDLDIDQLLKDYEQVMVRKPTKDKDFKEPRQLSLFD